MAKVGEVWYVMFPFEEDKTKFTERPCVVIGVDGDNVAIIKVTKHSIRDEYDVRIRDWRLCRLKCPSTARTSKLEMVKASQLLNKKGDLTPHDQRNVAQTLQKYLDSK